jgi:hypothetical protein
LVTEERNFGDTENAFGWVQKDTVILEFSEEGAEALVVLFRGTAKDKDIVSIGKTEIQVFKDTVHEMLKGLGGIS